MSFIAAASAIAGINLTVLNGDERQGVDLGLQKFYGKRFYLLGIISGSSAPLVTVLPDGNGGSAGGFALDLICAIAGFLVAVFFVFLARMAQIWLTRRSTHESGKLGRGPAPLIYTTPSDRFFILSDSERSAVERDIRETRLFRLAEWVYTRFHPSRKKNSLLVLFESALSLVSREGYFAPIEEGGWRRSPYAGHWYAIALAVLTFIVYVVAALGKWINLGDPAFFPTLAFLLLLLTVVCLILGGLTFFFDRFRVPILAILALFLGIGWDFGDRIKLISGVSGGSVGAAYFANAFKNSKLLPPRKQGDRSRWEESWKAAMESSLDDVAWGLVVPDFFGTLVPMPFLPWIDRGWALERAFASRPKGEEGLGQARLADWVKLTNSGRLPPLIFNTTSVERGNPFLFATVGFPSRQD